MRVFFLFMVIFSFSVSAQDFPKLIGDFDVGIEHIEKDYKVNDLIYKKDSRKLSYFVLYPGKAKNEEFYFMQELFSTEEDSLEKRFLQIFESLVEHYPSFDPNLAIGKMKLFYKSYTLNIGKSVVLDKTQQFPLLVFSPGSSSNKEDYLGLLEQVSSLGVIVIALDHHQWERGSKVIYSQASKDFHQYIERPDFDSTPRHAHHHMRAMDMNEAFNSLLKNDQFSSSIDLSKVFYSGHSYGGHTALYSARFKDERVAGYINLDGSFSPYGEGDIYDVSLIKEKVHILCVGNGRPGDLERGEVGSEICEEEMFKEFHDENISNQLESFQFKTIKGYGDVVHSDFGNFSLLEELYPIFDLVNNRKSRPSSGRIWHRISNFLYEIIKN